MATATRPDESAVDRLALSRAQHLKFRDNRRQSLSDVEQDSISDWSESDLECSPVSDFECTSNMDGATGRNSLGTPFDDIDDLTVDAPPLTNVTSLSRGARQSDAPLPVIRDYAPHTRRSISSDVEKSKQPQTTITGTNKKPPAHIRRPPQTPLLPARRVNSRQPSPQRPASNAHLLAQPPSYAPQNRKTIPPSPTRLTVRRGTASTSTSANTHSTKESSLASNSPVQSADDQHGSTHHRPTIVSPNLSHASMNNGVVPRIYEVKKVHVDNYDYGRLSDVSTLKNLPSRSRQKWGTIVHPPFPLGYQQVTSEQVTQAVERLASPVRCRDRHTPNQTPSKRYLSVEETEALISRLTKVKPIRSPDQYWPIPQPSRPMKHLSPVLKPQNNWKGVGIPA